MSEVVIATRAGAHVASLENARVRRARAVLNMGPETATIALPRLDPKLAFVQPWVYEVQIWEGSTLAWLGPIVSDAVEGDDEWSEFLCGGPLEYVRDRWVGRAQRYNWLANPSFDAGVLAPWTASGVTANLVQGWGSGRPGTYQLNLDQQGGGLDTFVRQTIQVPGGHYWTLAGWRHLRADTTFVGPALDDRGLYVERRNLSNVVQDVRFDPITAEHRIGQFEFVKVGIQTPAGADSLLDIRLYATRHTNPTPPSGQPAGGTIWDAIGLFQMESLAFSRADVLAIIQGLVAHGQDGTFGWSDVNLGAGGAATGILLDRAYQYVDHRPILDALLEFAEAGLVNIEVEWNANGTVRTVQVYAPRKERTMNEYALEWGRNIVRYGRERDGRAAKNAIIFLGPGEGPERHEGYGQASTAPTGGVTLGEILTADPSIHFDLLDSLAIARANERNRVPEIPEVTVNDSAFPIHGSLRLGDKVPVRIADGGVQIDSTLRVVAMEWGDDAPGEVTLTLNLV